MLRKTGQQVALSKVFAGFSDKRELQAAQPAPFLDRSQGQELWLDYVCDLGDGFDATASVASVLTQPSLTVPGPSADATGSATTRAGAARRGARPRRRPGVPVRLHPGVQGPPRRALRGDVLRARPHRRRRPGPARAAQGAARGGRAGQPRLVRRPHRLHPPVHAALHRLEAVALAGGMEGGAAAQLLRGEAAAPLVALGHRHPARHLHRQRPAGLVQGRHRAGGRARRRHHPLLGQAVLGRCRPRRPGRLRQPRLLRAQDHRAGRRQAPGGPDRRSALLRALRVPRWRRSPRGAEDHRRRRRGLPGADLPPAAQPLAAPERLVAVQRGPGAHLPPGGRRRRRRRRLLPDGRAGQGPPVGRVHHGPAQRTRLRGPRRRRLRRCGPTPCCGRATGPGAGRRWLLDSSRPGLRCSC